MKKLKTLFSLFFSMAKIGLFTFGGGYAMIGFFENEFVNRRKLLNNEEFLDLITIAESTPGPISINCSTYIGYKTAKFWGALFATLGLIFPTFLIIYFISLFFNAFTHITWIAAALQGIQICVIYLIFSAGIKMLKQLQKTPLNLILFITTFACMLILGVLSINFSSIYYILIAIGLGLVLHFINCLKQKKSVNKEEKE